MPECGLSYVPDALDLDVGDVPGGSVGRADPGCAKSDRLDSPARLTDIDHIARATSPREPPPGADHCDCGLRRAGSGGGGAASGTP